jgi:acyl-CoA hydrolase
MVAFRDERLSLSCNPEVTLDLLPMIEARRAAGETVLVVGQLNSELPFIENHAEVNPDAFDYLLEGGSGNETLFSTPNMPVSLPEHMIGLYASSLVKDGGTLQIGIGALGDALVNALLLRHEDNRSYQELIKNSGMQNRFPHLMESLGGREGFSSGLYGCSEMFTYGLLQLIIKGVICREVTDEEGRQILMHGGFFLGPKALYEDLRALPEEQLARIDLLNISFVNHLYGNETLKRVHRRDARFINTAFAMTLLGAAVSDQLEGGQVLSGVGGQYNFVAQAHELEGARSILLLRATRVSHGEVSSNIVWQYGHQTIPRHLRDIVITEYGIADLRGKTDSEVIKALLNITDSRFQQELMQQAQEAGKLEKDYLIPEVHCGNTPERLEKIVNGKQGCFPLFPLGTDFTDVEQQLMLALKWLKANARITNLLPLARDIALADEAGGFAEALERMDLLETNGVKEEIYKRLLLTALRATRVD